MKDVHIEDIVTEVIRRLEARKQDLLVVAPDTEHVDSIIQKLEKHWHVILFQGEIPTTIKHAIFLEVQQDLLVKGALGIADTEETKLFSKLMFLDCEVTFVPTDYLWNIISTEKRNSYLQQLVTYKERLLTYGVKFCPLEDFVSDEVASQNSSYNFKGKVITANDIETWDADQIYVEPGTIITPLAIDVAKEKGMMIEKIVRKKGNR